MDEGINFQPKFTGRKEEVSRLKELWTDAKDGVGSTAIISGEAGIGKTRLVAELMDEISQEGAEIIKGWCLADSLEPLIPFKEGLRDAGLSHLISEDPPPRVISAYLIKKGGLLIAKAERDKSELDPDIFASMLNAVGNFIEDSLDMMGEKEKSSLNALGYGDYDILIQTLGNLSLAVVITGTNSEFLIKDMTRLLSEIGDKFDYWDGDMSVSEEVKGNVEWFIDSKKYDGEHLVDDPKLKQENLFDKVLLGLRRVSADRPILLFMDDLQWADPTTLRLIHYLSRNTRKNKMLILGTYRPEDIVQQDDGKPHILKTTVQNMSREGLYQEIRLSRFSEESVGEFIGRTLDDLELDDEFVDKIYRESEGNPFFLLEFIRMLVEEGHLIKTKVGWEANANIGEVNIPSKVYDIVARRVDRLMEDHRELLECASVVGEEFESGVVGDVLGVNRIKLLRNLSIIEKNHNLIRSIKKKYVFDHGKIREVLYNSIMHELREEYHRMIAETYEKIYGEKDEVVYELARHWYEGGEYEKAFKCYEKASVMAKKAYANKLAIECYDRLLDMMPSLDILEYRRRKMIDILHKKGRCLKSMGEWGGSEKAFHRALQIAEELGDEMMIADSEIKMGDIIQLEGRYDESLGWYKDGSAIYQGIGDDKGYCESLIKIASIYNSKSEYDKSIEYLELAQDIAEKLQDNKIMSIMYGGMGSMYYGRGEMRKSLKYFEKKLKIAEEEGDLLEIGYTMMNMGTLYVKLQEYDKCMDICDRVLEIVEKTGDKLMEQNVLGKLGITYTEQGDYTKGLEYYKKKLSLSEKTGDKRSIAYVANNIGELYKEKGEYEKALEYYEKDVKISKDLGDKRGYAITVGNIGNLYKLMGDFDKADEMYDETIQIAKEQDTKDVLSFFTSCKADLYFEKDMVESAQSLNNEAMEIAERINMRQTLLNTNLLQAKITAKSDEKKGIKILKDMLEEEELEPEKAKLFYELYKMSGDEVFKKDALEFYRKIFERQPSKKYREIIEELEAH